ncbi:MAG: hypothetical protein DKM50_08170 [Candidatus Margulisiibacteriota bacterium]|nr:MAG: hypothetical protein A2X43_12565 [Candidatus Margulisbacteria bacterium GWD2_39_127]OGI01921.1 MAG: hypothetical protein A2X42_11840 [Candidatus Margulisbacteria bacterium GWF2_38_17]OGI11569.1 MAG: hypothetical protein A2X41_10065 [Candidatus Margulisbacteria bacterium GWE2_39_32]PZM79623.1 MAG: hypothetical protein DKM50_08170 [Candidatus Margulisiibacteriota bacterium]HAR62119.1 hypothetical protein [Candidatus Margulisiibacteriota bacterium]
MKNILKYVCLLVFGFMLTGCGELAKNNTSINENTDIQELNSNRIQKPLSGSFIQPWLVESWTSSNFTTELQYMDNVHMDHFIWQWTVDSTPSTMKAYYPTELAKFTGTATDPVGLSLEAAKTQGLKVWLGLNYTNDWWSKGANDDVWLTKEYNLSKQIAQELWKLFGANYGDTIAGFYLPMEVNNLNFDSTAEKHLISVYNDVATYIHTNMNKPVMVAPYFVSHADLNALQYAEMWGRIIVSAPIDIVAVQDGIGAGNATLTDIATWLSPLRAAIKKNRPATQFWIVLETFTTDYNSAPLSRVLRQLLAEQSYADKFTTFSFNHYDSPQQGHTKKYNGWETYFKVY